MDTDALAGDINEAMRRYAIIVGRFSLLQEKWKRKENLTKRTIAQYQSIINNVIPKIMNLDDFRPSEYYGSSMDDVLLKVMSVDVKSNGSLRSIRSAILHMVLQFFRGIANDLSNRQLSIESRQNLEDFSISLDKLDRLLKWFEALLVVKFTINKSNSNISPRQLLSASERDRIYQYLFKGNGRYWAAASVLFLTGCSPDDVRRGVYVEYSTGVVRFLFDYSKRGKELARDISIAVEDPFYGLAVKLKDDHSQIDLGGVELWRTSELARAVSNIGIEIGLKKTICPTSFRHAFACDLGRIGFSRNIIAHALGYKSGAARITFVRPKMGLKGRKVKVGWSEPGGTLVVHSTPDSKSDGSQH